MNQIDKLLMELNEYMNPPLNSYERGLLNNPFINKSYMELLDLLDGKNQEVYNKWPKFICALRVSVKSN